jgi:hypothetical protein
MTVTRRIRTVLKCLVAIVMFCGTLCAQDGDLDFFERKVRPLLAEHCFKCHGAARQESGLRLDHISQIRKGGDGGLVITGRDPQKSRLMIAVRQTDPDLKMPPAPDGRLKPGQVEILAQWIRLGTPWPREALPDLAPSEPLEYDERRRTHWAWQPVRVEHPPVVDDAGWSSTPIDRFIYAKLDEHHLVPARRATRIKLLRRVTFDLIGLPPSPDEVDGFLNDDSPDAFAAVVDRLLASPHYGERWARHWLDVVRYADTTANDGNFVMRYAYRYRNYVIDAFNNDLPYDQFVREQIAGDLLPHASSTDVLRGFIATGFLMLGPKGLAEADKERLRMDMVDEQIDVVGRAMLGVTLACARCHDHKFDPITTSDYYALAGIFRSLKMLNGNSGPTSMWHEGNVNIAVPGSEDLAQIESLKNAVRDLRDQWQRMIGDPDPAQVDWEKRLLTKEPDRFAQPVSAEAAPIRSPREIPGLIALYRAESLALKDGEPVTFWRNEAASDRDLALTAAPEDAPRFTVRSLNGTPAVHLAEKGHFLTSVDALPIDGAQPYSIYVVLNPRKSDAQRTQAVMWGDGSIPTGGTILEIDRVDTQYPRLDLATGHSVDAAAGKLTLGQPQIWGARYSGELITEAQVSVDGRLHQITESNASGQRKQATREGTLVVGGKGTAETRSSVSPDMDVAEIVIYRRALTDTEDQQIGAHLAAKYRLKTDYPDLLAQIVRKPHDNRGLAEQLTVRWLYLREHHDEFMKLTREFHAMSHQLAQMQSSANPNTQNSVSPVMFPLEQTGRDLRVHVRGNWQTLGDLAQRRTPHLFADEEPTPIDTSHSGRLELADWIASPLNRLTARVMVNRIWQYHFGRGLVASSDNFGRLGQSPSHPRLLDYLATRFMADGWSVKAMHRGILLSSTYQQSSTPVPGNAQSIDPENRLLWKFPLRRLEAEAIRDAVLAVSGQLDRRYGGGGQPMMELYEMGSVVDKKLGLVSVASVYDYEGFRSPRRSIYLPVIRNGQAEVLSNFDPADANAVTPRRNESTVATQAMFMLNSPFIREQSTHFARRLLNDPAADQASRIRTAFQLAFGRPASDQEIRDGADYLTQYQAIAALAGHSDAALERAWQSYCQILFCMNEFIHVE